MIFLASCTQYIEEAEAALCPIENQHYISSLVAGHGMSMVVMEDSSLWAWGNNSQGEIGNGATDFVPLPTLIMTNVKMASSAFGRTAAVGFDGSLWMWGNNAGGLYGNGTTEDSLYPVKIMDDVLFVSVGDTHTAIIKVDNSLWVWGAHNQASYLDNMFPRVPTRVMENVIYVSAGFSGHTMAITYDLGLWTWGFNYSGELGIGEVHGNIYLPPVKVMDNVVQVVAGSEITSALTSDGYLWSWGNNQVGAVGDGTRNNQWYPIIIMSNVRYISLTSAITKDDIMWAWGMRIFNDGTSIVYEYPTQVAENVAMMSSMSNALIKTNDGALWLWESAYTLRAFDN